MNLTERLGEYVASVRYKNLSDAVLTEDKKRIIKSHRPYVSYSMVNETDIPDTNIERAEIFEAISHPLRIRILQKLDEKPLGFADLKRAVGIESSGHLSFHLSKLTHLVRTTPEGTYSLTDDGNEALWSITALRKSTSGSHSVTHGGTGIKWQRAAILSIGILILLSTFYVATNLPVRNVTETITTTVSTTLTSTVTQPIIGRISANGVACKYTATVENCRLYLTNEGVPSPTASACSVTVAGTTTIGRIFEVDISGDKGMIFSGPLYVTAFTTTEADCWLAPAAMSQPPVGSQINGSILFVNGATVQFSGTQET